MKLNLAESIREVLCDRQPVSIYGLGTLRLRQLAASYGEKRKTLLPPSMTLELSDASSTNHELIRWLCIKYEISHDVADKAIRRFSEQVLNNLLNYGSVYIDKVVLLERDGDNDIICEPDPSLLEGFYEGLPEVFLEMPSEELPGTVDTDKSAQALYPNTGTDRAEKEQEDIVYPDEVEEDPLAKAFDNAEENDAGMTADEMIVFDLESELKKLDGEPGAQDLPVRDSDEINYKAIWGYILLVVALIAACILIYDACSTYQFNKKLDNTSSEGKPVDLAGAGAADSLSKAMLEGEELSQAAMPDSCIIITGVFASPANVEAMLRKLEEFNYTPYTELNGLYIRVGLIFECSGVDLEAFIRTIRSEISARAWYLQPELYVAYGTGG